MRHTRRLSCGAMFFSFLVCLFAMGCNTNIDPVGSSDGAEDPVTEDSEPVCGNGIVEQDEECDDGENNSDTTPDACRADCHRAHCGDGVLDSGEVCDGSRLDGVTCESLGMSSDGLVCDTGCRLDVSGCRGCGNGTCELGESLPSCPADCHDGCGNGTCEEAEDQFSCPADCGAIDISAGSWHTCAILADGTVRCWGRNDGGQLGDGTQNASDVPVPVLGLSEVVDISEGYHHNCAILSNGTARCWGLNDGVQLGDGIVDHPDCEMWMTGDCSSVPVEVSGLSTATAISGGFFHTCSSLSDGTAMCWGKNNFGQLGDGTTTNSHVPVPVTELTGAVAISAGLVHTCAALSDGTAKCWGGSYGNVPVQVVGLTRVVAILAGGTQTCALISDGTVMCWGDNDAPVSVSDLPEAVAIASGDSNTCTILYDGSAKCWGSNYSGQLGDGLSEHPGCDYFYYGDCSTVPVTVLGLTEAFGISVGYDHACALLTDGTANCWGGNNSGQLGDGLYHSICEHDRDIRYDCSLIPVPVAPW